MPLSMQQSRQRTQVFDRTNFLRLCQSLIEGDSARVVVHLIILPQIALECREHNLHTGAVLVDFSDPLRPDVLERVATVDLYTPISALFFLHPPHNRSNSQCLH